MTNEEIIKSFIEDVEAVKDQLPCGEQMDFPSTFDEFANEYGFKDKEEVYTNGSELIQVYRVKQWLEHINETTTMIDKSNFSREQYKADLQSAYDCGYNQACKGKITMPYAEPDNCGNCIEQTAMSDLAVNKLISDCEKMSFDMEIFNKPLKVVALDAVKNIVKDLSSVTPQEPRWIPVSERLPEEDTDVFICNANEEVEITRGFYSTEMKDDFVWCICRQFGKVIAWMPLPQPYREVEE